LTGASRPLRRRQYIQTPAGVVSQEVTVVHEMTSGFEVIPRLIGDRVQVEVAEQRLLTHRLLGRAQDEGGLSVAAGRVDEDVLAVEHVRDELAQLGLAVGERLVERQVAEGEGVGCQPPLLCMAALYSMR